MKKIYVFTRDSEKFTCETVVFRVFVGKSRREQVRASLLECFCNDMGYFWRIKDDDTDFWLESKAAEIRPSSEVPLLHVKRASVNVCTLYRLIMDGELEAYEANLPISNSLYKVISICDAKYFAEHIFSAKPSLRPELKRKYLSRSNWSEGKKAIACCTGVLMLIILDALFGVLTGL